MGIFYRAGKTAKNVVNEGENLADGLKAGSKMGTKAVDDVAKLQSELAQRDELLTRILNQNEGVLKNLEQATPGISKSNEVLAKAIKSANEAKANLAKNAEVKTGSSGANAPKNTLFSGKNGTWLYDNIYNPAMMGFGGTDLGQYVASSIWDYDPSFWQAVGADTLGAGALTGLTLGRNYGRKGLLRAMGPLLFAGGTIGTRAINDLDKENNQTPVQEPQIPTKFSPFNENY